MKRLLFLLSLTLLIPWLSFSQSTGSTLTLEECYDILYNENPITNKIEMSKRITELNQKIAQSGWYPDLQVNASASYQSDVVDFPFEAPNFDIPNFSKDHYNLALNITQPIYDGGRTKAAKELEGDSGEITEASLEADLLRIKEQVDRIYLGILILEKRKDIAGTVLSDMSEQLEIVESQVENGVMLPGNERSLRAEILNKEQELTKINSDISAGYEALREILGHKIDLQAELQLPVKERWQNDAVTDLRPEMELLNAREDLLETQKSMANVGKRPTLSLFATPSYGRPGFNFFEDDLQFNWIVGIQARWSLKSTRNASLKTDALDLQRQKVVEDKELFKRQQSATMRRLANEIKVIEKQIEQDEEIVELRKQVAEEKRNQVEQGAGIVTEYITELNAQQRAQLQLELHKIQRVQAIINYETEQGWTWN